MRRPLRSLLREVHVSTKLPPIVLGPVAHTAERCDNCPHQRGQGILDSNRLRLRSVPHDQPCRFEITKSSGKHPLRDTSEMAPQLSVSIRLRLQENKILGCPSSDEERRGHFFIRASWYSSALQQRGPRHRMVRVTSVAGFRWTR